MTEEEEEERDRIEQEEMIRLKKEDNEYLARISREAEYLRRWCGKDIVTMEEIIEFRRDQRQLEGRVHAAIDDK